MKRLLVFGCLLCIAIVVLFSCQKEYSLESNVNTAVFSIHDDSTFSCFPITVKGTYYNGVSAARDTNYVMMVVNVKQTGSYSISSSLSNGFTFTDSGFFSQVGYDTITLKASGTPILIKSTEFTVSAGDTLGYCNFFVDVQDSTGTGLGGDTTATDTTGSTIDTSYLDLDPATDSSWHFTDSATGETFSGTMGVAGNSLVDSSGWQILTLAGLTADSAETFGFILYTQNASIATGVYPITGNTSLGLITNDDGNPVYASNEILLSEAESYSYIKITGYDETTKHIEGSFHVWAIDGQTAELKLLKGSFNTYLP